MYEEAREWNWDWRKRRRRARREEVVGGIAGTL